jgi:serine/threonine protein kinase
LETLALHQDTLVSCLRGSANYDAEAHDSRVRDVVARIQAIGRDPSYLGGQPGLIDGQKRGRDAAGALLGTIRDYRLLARLGEGGMGTLYEALHTRLDKIVALKVLPAGQLSRRRRSRVSSEKCGRWASWTIRTLCGRWMPATMKAGTTWSWNMSPARI